MKNINYILHQSQPINWVISINFNYYLDNMTEQQPQSAVDSQPKFQKPRKQKVRKDPNAPFIREKLELPEGHNKLLLHSCCAPCSGEVMEAILASGIEFTIYFYNPNIHPLKRIFNS